MKCLKFSTQIDEEGDWQSDMEEIVVISATHSHTLYMCYTIY